MIEEKENPKLIFGLSPRATIVNAVILFFCGQIFWGLNFMEQFPPGFNFKNPPADFVSVDNVPWYFHWPFYCIAMIMALRWIRFTFKTTPGSFDSRTLKYEYLYLVLGFILLDIISRFLILLFLIMLR